MKDVAKYPGLMQRRTKWYLRVVVPDDVSDVIGKREIWRSLDTGDYQEAKRRYLDKRAQAERTFAITREGETGQRQMVGDWFCRRDQMWAEDDFGIHGPDLQDAAGEAEIELSSLLHGDSEEVMSYVADVADEILISRGWLPNTSKLSGPIKPIHPAPMPEIDKGGEWYRNLCGYVRRALVEVYRRRTSRLRGYSTAGAHDPMFAGDVAVVEPRVAITPKQPLPKAPLLTEVFKKWKAERKPSDKTAHEWKTAVRRFTEVSGDLPVDAITVANVRDFKDALLQLPVTVKHGLRGKTVPQLITATKNQNMGRLAPGTVNKQLTAIRALLSWCRKNGYVKANVAADLSVPTSKNDGDRRLPYSSEEMQVLLCGLEDLRDGEPAKFWLPLLAAFTGARLEELGQLRVADIRCRDGIDFIDINSDDEGKSLKTRSSRREVPLHRELLRFGLLRYVSCRKEDGDVMLFPDLKVDSMGKLTGSFSKWWSRYSRGLGVKDRRKVFHSFRHGFIDACRFAGIGEETRNALTGHTGGGVGRSYGAGVPLQSKAKAIAKLRFGGLDLSMLH